MWKKYISQWKNNSFVYTIIYAFSSTSFSMFQSNAVNKTINMYAKTQNSSNHKKKIHINVKHLVSEIQIRFYNIHNPLDVSYNNPCTIFVDKHIFWWAGAAVNKMWKLQIVRRHI